MDYFDLAYYYQINSYQHYHLFIMKSTPVICGIDLGSWTVKISVFNGEKFEVLTN